MPDPTIAERGQILDGLTSIALQDLPEADRRNPAKVGAAFMRLGNTVGVPIPLDIVTEAQTRYAQSLPPEVATPAPTGSVIGDRIAQAEANYAAQQQRDATPYVAGETPADQGFATREARAFGAGLYRGATALPGVKSAYGIAPEEAMAMRRAATDITTAQGRYSALGGVAAGLGEFAPALALAPTGVGGFAVGQGAVMGTGAAEDVQAEGGSGGRQLAAGLTAGAVGAITGAIAPGTGRLFGAAPGQAWRSMLPRVMAEQGIAGTVLPAGQDLAIEVVGKDNTFKDTFTAERAKGYLESGLLSAAIPVGLHGAAAGAGAAARGVGALGRGVSSVGEDLASAFRGPEPVARPVAEAPADLAPAPAAPPIPLTARLAEMDRQEAMAQAQAQQAAQVQAEIAQAPRQLAADLEQRHGPEALGAQRPPQIPPEAQIESARTFTDADALRRAEAARVAELPPPDLAEVRRNATAQEAKPLTEPARVEASAREMALMEENRQLREQFAKVNAEEAKAIAEPAPAKAPGPAPAADPLAHLSPEAQAHVRSLSPERQAELAPIIEQRKAFPDRPGDLGNIQQMGMVLDSKARRAAKAAAPAPKPVEPLPRPAEPAAPVESTGKAPAEGTGFHGEHRLRSGSTTLGAKPVETVGNASAIFRQPDGKFVIAHTSPEAVRNSRKLTPGGQPRATLWTIAGKEGRATDATAPRFATVDEARTAAQALDAKLKYHEPLLGERTRGAAPKDEADLVMAERAKADPEYRAKVEAMDPAALEAERATVQKSGARAAPENRIAAGQEGQGRTVMEAAEKPGAGKPAEPATPVERPGSVHQTLRRTDEAIATGSKEKLDVLHDELSESAEAADQLVAKLLDSPGLRKLRANPADPVAREQFKVLRNRVEKHIDEMRPLIAEDAPHTVVPDGLDDAQRTNLLRDFAKEFGYKWEVANKELTHNGVPVLGVSSGDTILTRMPVNIAHGVRILSHEIVHGEVAKLAPAVRAELMARIARLPGADALAEAIVKRWKGSVAVGDALEEAIAEAGSRAIMRDRGGLLSILSPAVAAPLRAVLTKVATAIRTLVNKLSGLKGANAVLRESLQDEADALFRAARARQKPGVAAGEPLREVVAALGKPEARIKDYITESGDLAGGTYRWLGSVSDTAASFGSWVYHKFIADAQSLADRYSAFGSVWRAHFEAHAAAKRLANRASETLDWWAKAPKSQTDHVGRVALDTTLEQIHRRDAGLEPLTGEAETAFMRSRGAADADIGHIREAHTALGELWDARVQSIKAAAGVAREATIADIDKMIAGKEAEIDAAREAKVEPASGAPGELSMLRAVRDAVSGAEEAKRASYVPLMRIPRGARIEARLPSGEIINYQTSTIAERTALAEKIAAEHPDAKVAILPPTAHIEGHGGGWSEAALNGLAGKAGVEGKAAEAFIEAVKPALLGKSFKAHLERAKGVEGYETDLRQVLPHYINSITKAIEKLEFSSRSSEGVKQIAAGARTMPGLHKFTTEWIHDAYHGEAGPVRDLFNTGRLLASAHYLLSPISGGVNILNSLMLAPFHLSLVSKGSGAAYLRSWQSHLGSTLALAPATMVSIAKTAHAALTGQGFRAAVDHLYGPGAAKIQFGTMARMLELTGQHDVAKALRTAVDSTEILQDQHTSDFLTPAHSGMTKVAKEAAVGALVFQTVTDRAGRGGTFISAFKQAKTFTAADWKHLHETVGYTDADTPYRFALWETGKVNGYYGKAYRPAEFRSPEGAAVFQFAQWPMQQTKNLVHLAGVARKDLGAGNPMTAGMYIGMLGLLVGAGGLTAGLPFAEPIAKAAEWGLHNLPYEDDPTGRKSFDDLMREHANDNALARFGYYGAPGLLENKDLRDSAAALGRRASLKGLMVERMMSLADVPMERAIEDLYHGAGGLIQGALHHNGDEAAQGASRLLGPWSMQLRELEARREDPSRGYRSMSEPNSKELVPRSQMSALDELGTAVGLAPIKAEEARDIKSYEKEMKETVNKPDIRNFADNFAGALERNDEPAKAAALDQIRKLVAARKAALDAATTPGARAEAIAALQGLSSDSIKAQVTAAVMARRYGQAFDRNKYLFAVEQQMLQGAALHHPFPPPNPGEFIKTP